MLGNTAENREIALNRTFPFNFMSMGQKQFLMLSRCSRYLGRQFRVILQWNRKSYFRLAFETWKKRGKLFVERRNSAFICCSSKINKQKVHKQEASSAGAKSFLPFAPQFYRTPSLKINWKALHAFEHKFKLKFVPTTNTN